MRYCTNLAKDRQPKSNVRRASAGLLALGLLALGLLGARAEDRPPTPVVFLPHWIPQAQFAGYYLALEQGIYRQHGLDVTILDGGPRKPVEPALRSGEATFASHFLSSALQLRDQGLPLVHLAQLTQRSALMLVAHKSRGIHTVKDLDGKKVSLWPSFSAQPRALFRRNNLRVQTITQGPTINLFMRGGVDAASAMWYNEYHLFLNSGLNEDEVTLVFFNQPDLNFPEDCLLCLGDTWRTQPEVCRQFVRASLEGWKYVAAHREESLRVVLLRTEKAHTGTNRSHQRWMLDRLCELIQPVSSATAFGQLNREDYERVARELQSGGEIKFAVPFEDFHARLDP